MRLTFMVSLAAVTLLFVTMCKYELTAKHTRAQVRALRRRLVGEDGSPARRGRTAVPAVGTQAAGRSGL